MDIYNNRYREAYRVARGTMGLARAIRGCGVAAAILLALFGVAIFGRPDFWSFPIGMAFFVGAVVILLAAFSAYAIIAAQAQIMVAQLDTAIHTSPLIDNLLRSQMIERI